MAVVSVEPRPFRAASGSMTDAGREYTIVFFVTTNDPLDGPATILQDTRLPQLNSPYAFGNDVDDAAFLKSLDPRPIDKSNTKWEVVAKYQPLGEEPGNVPQPDPLELPAKVEIGFQQFTAPVESATFMGLYSPRGNIFKPDVLGPNCSPVAVVGDNMRVSASNGEPYDPPPERDDSRMLIRITRNEPFLRDDLFTYINKINGDFFFIRSGGLNYPIFDGGAKMQSIQAVNNLATFQKYVFVTQFNTAIQTIRRQYWTVTYELAIKASLGFDMNLQGFVRLAQQEQPGWDIYVLDRGFTTRYCPGDKDDSYGNINAEDIYPERPRPPVLEIKDPRDYALSTTSLLDGKGKLAETVPAKSGRTEQRMVPVFSRWQIYDVAMFFRLQL